MSQDGKGNRENKDLLSVEHREKDKSGQQKKDCMREELTSCWVETEEQVRTARQKGG